MSKGYESEFTKFMRDMKAKHPEWAEAQQQGYRLLWNRKVDFSEQQAFADASTRPNFYRWR